MYDHMHPSNHVVGKHCQAQHGKTSGTNYGYDGL